MDCCRKVLQSHYVLLQHSVNFNLVGLDSITLSVNWETVFPLYSVTTAMLPTGMFEIFITRLSI